ncbi:putative transcription factor/ chromatin remodeling BED-type(Zn) family [Helianthus annuus]|uniref:Transcription factor/ chromatin remodeling BED-type(Zn) family n=1 Tax=Helianthus annuus TaxID=4232 RepID=A0A9K3MYS0_HELAN|nr:zinc finger BED domain-containing protein RICESLEEPER 1 [Helianthus annuus]XP_021993098.1 zinc finger BED domain-containing protein RICESLEEPER 1 [Helianthus annuus]KAF5780727.1 putative transcription factor/ chromatin remodeling BED-type(Zn) family [Helianthus annuus]KAJ0516329.1 putative transcription factor/ chromatin remodeling BED-type(Zn) family [Helianthus annuus]KAJ0873937.1 putative transcription factor/ chromatin remodeling BED-type(Zn) family [Helianthus annuus]
MEIQTETPVKKPKRLTSVVWNHFERVRKAEACYAVCVHCQKKLSGSSNSGTTHLRNHLMRCLKRSNFDVSQILAAKRKRKDEPVTIATVGYDEVQRKDENVIPIAYHKFDHESKVDGTINLGSVKFDQERSRVDLARMIMLHDYPPSMVEHVGFKIFVKNLQPMFEVLTTGAIESDCLTIYAKERQKVFDVVRNLHGRISLAVGFWSSPENVDYLSLTANYIDDSWKLQRKILNFLTLDSSQTEDAISELLIKCLMDWDVDQKLFSLTLDDCFRYDNLAYRIKNWLAENRPVLDHGELFDIRCASHLVKSLLEDSMESIKNVIEKIRESVRFVKSSLTTHGKFDEFAQQAGINTEKCLSLDNQMRWNSTYLMLESVLEYKSAFFLLQEHDASYTSYLSDEEWQRVGSVTSFIKLLVEVINVFSHSQSKYPTSNVFFPEICDVHIQLIDYCKNPDEFISSLATEMKIKFDKYWNKSGLGLAIAAILDPRFKMKLVEYYYKQIYDTEAPERIREVSEGISNLFNEYSVDLGGSVDDVAGKGGSGLIGTSNAAQDRLRGFDKFLNETSNQQSGGSDLDKYLEEPVFPRNYDFNILNWWKVHTPRYPILSTMVRDILGVPVSTLTADLAFSTGGRVIDNHLRSVDPDIRQALICGQDWLRMEPEDTNASGLSVVPLAIELT